MHPATATPTRCSTGRRSRRSARPGRTPQIFRELARAHGLRRALLRRRRRDAGRSALPTAGRRRFRRAARARLGQARRSPTRRSPRAASPRRPASCRERRARRSACPTICPTTSRRRARPGSRARFPLAMISPPARNFLNSTFVNVPACATSRASRCSRSTRATPRARGIADGADGAGLQRPRRVPLQGRGRARAPGPAWSTAWASGGASSAPDGTQRQPAHAPAAHRHRPRRRASTTAWSRSSRPRAPAAVKRGWRMASLGLGGLLAAALLAAAAVCLTSGCATLGYYGQSATGHLSRAARRGRSPSGWPTRRPRRASRPGWRSRSASATSPSPSSASPTTPATAAMPTCSAAPRCGTWSPRPSSRSTLKTWCFLVVGCVGYRGYYDRAERRGPRPSLRRREGSSVCVYPVPAYSTLGRLPGRLAGRPAAQHLHRLSRRRTGAADLPRARAPGRFTRRATRCSTNRSPRAVERIGAERWLGRPASAAGARPTPPAAKRAAPTSAP